MMEAVTLRRYLIQSVWLLAAISSAADSPSPNSRFDFGSGTPAAGHTKVTPDTLYSAERGFGLEPGAEVKVVTHDRKDLLKGDLITSSKPFYFSVAVPEGNYKVTVTMGDYGAESRNTIKAELRRLMIEDVRTRPGQFAMRTFLVNVRRPQIPTGGEVRLKDREKTSEAPAWDEKLTLEFNGERPAICALQVEKMDNVPTVYLAGDSTVADQPVEPYTSWGNMITRFFLPTVVVANHAESGESLRSFIGENRLAKIESTIRSGDYLFIQMGHNDQKDRSEGAGAFTTYKAALKQFIAMAKSKGATPVLLTSMHRRTFDESGKITNSLGDFPEAVRQTAKEENVVLIDLHAMSKPLYEALGPEQSPKAFAPGDGTHHNNYGAYELAKAVVEGIRTSSLPLKKHLIEGLRPYDPAKPQPVDSFTFPASPVKPTAAKPLGS